MTGIQYPVDIKDIGEFEHQNNVSVNVYAHEDKKIFPTSTVARHHLNLLYITTSEKFHYVLVQDLSKLVSSQFNNNKHKRYFCQYCLHSRTGGKVLKNHQERRKFYGAQRIKLPEADNKKVRNKVKFIKTEHQLRLYFVIYTDFERLLSKQD